MTGYAWSDRDLDALYSAARLGVSLEQIAATYNRARGVRKRTVSGVMHKLTEMHVAYGRQSASWTGDELAFLRSWAGRLPSAELRGRLTAETGIERTAMAVRKKLTELGLPRGPWRNGWHTLGQAGDLLGLRAETVWILVKSGRLEAVRHGAKWSAVSDAAIEALLRREPLLCDPERMPRGRFRSLVELDQRVNRWMPVETVTPLLGFKSQAWVTKLCQRGVIPATKGRRGSGAAGRPRWWIKASDMRRWLAERDGAQRGAAAASAA